MNLFKPSTDCSLPIHFQFTSFQTNSIRPSSARMPYCFLFPAYIYKYFQEVGQLAVGLNHPSTHSHSWCTRPSQSPCCHWLGNSRWCWLARSHTCGAGFPWRAGGRWEQRHSGKRRSGSSHPTASSRTGSRRPRWSSGLQGSHAHTHTNHGGDAGAADAAGLHLWSL